MPVEPIYHNLDKNDSLVALRLLEYDFIDINYVHPTSGDTISVHAIFDNVTWKNPTLQLGGVVDPATDIPENIILSSFKITFKDSTNDFKLIVTIKPIVNSTGNIRYGSRCTFLINNFSTYHFNFTENGLVTRYNDLVFENFFYKGIQFNDVSRPSDWMGRPSFSIINKNCFPVYININNNKSENRFYHFTNFK